jgi:methylenetetrahydrofolate dehydrogenase (NADP+)/methenyltetrahydrofolate cyclohydrolase
VEEVTGSSPVGPTSNYLETVFTPRYNTAQKLAGTPIAKQIQDGLRQRVGRLSVAPRLAIVHTSPDPAADTYVRLKSKFGAAVGVQVDVLRPDASELTATIDRLNADPAIHGIIVQLPLPPEVVTADIVAQVDPARDVDGLNPHSSFVTAGPRGIMELLDAYEVGISGARVVLVGAGRLMGEPLRRLLEVAGAQVDVFSLERPIEPSSVRKAAIIIGATGQRSIITSDMVSSGSVVVDATGVDTDPSLQQRDDIRITPSTGGVGPMTVAALFENLFDASV